MEDGCPRSKVRTLSTRSAPEQRKLLKKVGYTAMKEAGLESKRPNLPNLKIEKRGK
jgi:hypothetical protein